MMARTISVQQTEGAIIVNQIQHHFPVIEQIIASASSEISYNPNFLLDTISKSLAVKNDAALARRLRVNPSHISKVRHLTLPVTADLLISLHEESGMQIRDLRLLMGDRRRIFKPISLKDCDFMD